MKQLHQLTWQKSLILAACLCIGPANLAWAQYVWLDEKGVKQFTDIPPPPNTPKNRILKSPTAPRPETNKPAEGTEASAAGSVNAANAASAKSAPPTIADRNAEFNKRKQEQAEKDKKDAAEAEKRVANQRNCDAARANQRNLDSGARITQTDKNGERAFISDEQKAQMARENRRILEGCQ